MTIDAAGHLKEKSTSRLEPADLTSDLKLSFALKRRGLAFEMAEIMDYKTHEMLSEKLLAAYMRDPFTGYARVTLEQLVRADQEAFRQLAVATRAGIKRDADGHRPCDKAMKVILNDPEFRQTLMNLPGSSGKKRSKSEDSESEAPASKKQKKTRAQRLSALRARVEGLQQQLQTRGAKGAGKEAKGKGKGRMPAALIGMDSMTADGTPICYGFNLPDGCKAGGPGHRCPRGLHVCCKPGCHQHHSLQQHK